MSEEFIENLSELLYFVEAKLHIHTFCPKGFEHQFASNVLQDIINELHNDEFSEEETEIACGFFQAAYNLLVESLELYSHTSDVNKRAFENIEKTLRNRIICINRHMRGDKNYRAMRSLSDKKNLLLEQEKKAIYSTLKDMKFGG